MNKSVFIVRNQLGQYWIRAGEWVDGREPQRVQRFEHRDEAVNLLVELSAKDIELRGEILHCELSDRDELAVDASEHRTPSLAEKAAARAAAEREAASAAESELALADGETAAAATLGAPEEADTAAAECDTGEDQGAAADDDGDKEPAPVAAV